MSRKISNALIGCIASLFAAFAHGTLVDTDGNLATNQTLLGDIDMGVGTLWDLKQFVFPGDYLNVSNYAYYARGKAEQGIAIGEAALARAVAAEDEAHYAKTFAEAHAAYDYSTVSNAAMTASVNALDALAVGQEARGIGQYALDQANGAMVIANGAQSFAEAHAAYDYSTVSNAAMNARSATDLGVRGAPQGEGSWFTVNGQILAWNAEGEYWGDDSMAIDDYSGHYYFFGWELEEEFQLDENFSHVITFGTNTYVIVGYTNTLAQVSQIPDISVKQDALPYPTNAIPYSAVTGAPDVPSLAGLPPFDFADMRGVYLSLSNLIYSLGGSVTNFPTFQE